MRRGDVQLGLNVHHWSWCGQSGPCLVSGTDPPPERGRQEGDERGCGVEVVSVCRGMCVERVQMPRVQGFGFMRLGLGCQRVWCPGLGCLGLGRLGFRYLGIAQGVSYLRAVVVAEEAQLPQRALHRPALGRVRLVQVKHVLPRTGYCRNSTAGCCCNSHIGCGAARGSGGGGGGGGGAGIMQQYHASGVPADEVVDEGDGCQRPGGRGGKAEARHLLGEGRDRVGGHQS